MRWGRHSHDEGDRGDWLVVGAPDPGTEASVDHVARDGVGAIKAVDPAFDSDSFTEWAGSVYERAVAAWRSTSPELLRPVMANAVWNSYAEYMLMVSRVALGQKVMASARATPDLVGAAADSCGQSVLVSFAVVATAYDPSFMEPDGGQWRERWLFQRSLGFHTHASGAVAVCPVCGAPADPDDSGECRYCHSDISTRTAGWRVTQTATTMVGAARMAKRLAERESTRPVDAAPPAATTGAPLQPPRAGPPLQPPRSP
jgi:hypothetical protein